MINGNCTDISKRRVEDVFAAVAGYALAVDPTCWEGPMVCKSDENAVHDGAIVFGPSAVPLPGRAYQRVIDNRHGDAEVLDIRPCVVGDEIPFCYLKYRPVTARFGNANSRVVHVPTADVLSAQESDLILRFCRAIGRDLGELDVFRDRTDGRIYVVDVAKTPHSPPDAYLTLGGLSAMRWAAAAFRRQFLGAARR